MRVGLSIIDAGEARDDLKRPLANAITTIDLLRFFLWVVAAAIVGSVLYVSALERSRDLPCSRRSAPTPRISSAR